MVFFFRVLIRLDFRRKRVKTRRCNFCVKYGVSTIKRITIIERREEKTPKLVNIIITCQKLYQEALKGKKEKYPDNIFFALPKKYLY